MLDGEALRSGEGELHALLSVIGLTRREFCALVYIEETTFSRWYGFPLHPWAVEFLRYYGWAKNMAKALEARGVDPEQFKPKLPERKMPTGRYPRTAEQVDELLRPFRRTKSEE
jgi:hypothetical protein